MDRRDFFKIVSTVSAGVATNACGKKQDVLIPLLVPNHEMAPGEEDWRPAVCTECSAGCGTIARVMQGERIIERNGQKFRERIACVKKLEGNPLDPVSGGRLCARGHAALQSLYNPDRVTRPMRRRGSRGKAEFVPASWDECIAALSEKLAKARTTNAQQILFLTTPQESSQLATVQRFLNAIGAPPALTCSPGDFAIEKKAAAAVFGWDGIPRYDLANARYVLGVGADFLGGWTSPVYYGRQFGHFRQGRLGTRGRLVHAESRMSLTAGSADEWLPIRPGSEPHLLAGIGRILLDSKLARNSDALPASVRESFSTANLDDAFRLTGIQEKRLRRIARELGESEGPLLMAGASVVHSNSIQTLVAAHYLNLLLGNIEKPGGLFPPAMQAGAAAGSAAGAKLVDALRQAQIVMLNGANPVYTLPGATAIVSALAHVDTIASFGMFIDDSAAYADLMLPSNHPLESEMAVVSSVSSAPVSIAVATPFVQPLHDTRPLEQTLDAIARKMQISFQPVAAANFVQPFLTADQSWEQVVRDGGLWRDEKPNGAASAKTEVQKLAWTEPAFSGDLQQYPLQLQPYLSVQYHDGSGANLPWMQELPDPASSAMWDVPVEIDPKTAAQHNIATGDWVRLESPHGSLETTAYVHPAALPGVVSMPIGQGHAHYGRYASARGANPLSIVAPVWEDATGVLAFGATRVRLARLERTPALIQFAPNDREQGPWGYR